MILISVFFLLSDLSDTSQTGGISSYFKMERMDEVWLKRLYLKPWLCLFCVWMGIYFKKHSILGNLLDSNAPVVNHTVLYTWRCWDAEFYATCCFFFFASTEKKGTLGIKFAIQKKKKFIISTMLLLLSHFSHVWLFVTPQTAAHRLPCPWDSPGINTGVGCHFLLQCMKVKSESEVV